MRIVMAAAALAATLSSPAAGKTSELGEVRAKSPVVTLKSTKSAAALEMCVGDRMTDWGPPTVLRGEGETVVALFLNTGVAFLITVVATLKPTEGGTIVEMRAKNFAWDGKARSIAEGCV